MTTFPDHHGSLDVPSPSIHGADYGLIGAGYNGADYRDPRTSSTQSLTPSDYNEHEKRKLLLVYIHGFMGNDNSFQNFPFHVHRFLRDRLRETHAVHTKIYPRYKTYKAIEVARDNFSRWLQPHESPDTDVVLVGHSMGGLLAAEVALMASLPASPNIQDIADQLTRDCSPTKIGTTSRCRNIESLERSTWTRLYLASTRASSRPA